MMCLRLKPAFLNITIIRKVIRSSKVSNNCRLGTSLSSASARPSRTQLRIWWEETWKSEVAKRYFAICAGSYMPLNPDLTVSRTILSSLELLLQPLQNLRGVQLVVGPVVAGEPAQLLGLASGLE